MTVNNQENQVLQTPLGPLTQKTFDGFSVTGMLCILAIIPAADEYFSLQNKHAQQTEQLIEAQTEAEQLEFFKTKVDQRRENIQNIRMLKANAQAVQELQTELVRQARSSKCRVRKVVVGTPRRRDWFPGDHPLKPRRASDINLKAKQELISQPLILKWKGLLVK